MLRKVVFSNIRLSHPSFCIIEFSNELNTFEQLCINYANEKIHQVFVSRRLKDFQAYFQEEQLGLDEISFFDNVSILGKKFFLGYHLLQ